LALGAIDKVPETAPAILDLGGRPIVIFVGRLSIEKNIELLLGIAADVCRMSNVVFLVCGDGPLRGYAEATIRALNLGHCIRLLGERADVWTLMKASSVFVSTSAFEGQPNAVLEAMACGCPLVVSDIPAHREFLTSATAEIVRLDRSEFASAVTRVLQGSPSIVARTVAARRQVKSFTPESVAAAYDKIYREVMGNRDQCAG
jgi:glycosyltransferase involved in cell wall biosynthesis